MEMHACLLFVDMLEEYNVSLFQRLKITEKGDNEDTDNENSCCPSLPGQQECLQPTRRCWQPGPLLLSLPAYDQGVGGATGMGE